MRYIRYLKKSTCPFPFATQSFLKTCPLRSVGLLPHEKPAAKIEPVPPFPMSLYKQKFEQSIDSLKKEGRYREFIQIKRQAGQYPIALNLHNVKNGAEPITLWCSNDYLGLL